MQTAFRLFIISSESFLDDEIEIACDLLALGADAFHLRKPGWTIDQMHRYLEQFPETYRRKIVIHSHFELVTEFNLHGAHLNEANRKLEIGFYAKKFISSSFHNLHELEECTYPFEYAFLSPIFNSISKPGYNSQFDLKKLKPILAQKDFTTPIIALGGINSTNVNLIKSVGFEGAAFLGAIWQAENPLHAFIEIQSALNGQLN